VYRQVTDQLDKSASTAQLWQGTEEEVEQSEGRRGARLSLNASESIEEKEQVKQDSPGVCERNEKKI